MSISGFLQLLVFCLSVLALTRPLGSYLFRVFEVRSRCRASWARWRDLVRGLLYVLLPLAIAGTLIHASQGVIQNFAPALQV